jgi:hypothetical protein
VVVIVITYGPLEKSLAFVSVVLSLADIFTFDDLFWFSIFLFSSGKYS